MGEILVQVIPAAQAGEEIGFNRANIAERLDQRLDDVRAAVASGTEAVAASLPGLPDLCGWHIGEVSAAFGIALTAEAGALVTKASVGATFEVTVKFTRERTTHAGRGP